jgi:hypothetical protein
MYNLQTNAFVFLANEIEYETPPKKNSTLISPYFLHDKDKQNNVILESYFNDIYKVFLSRISKLGMTGKISSEEKKKLRLLLNELIKVKTILSEDDRR